MAARIVVWLSAVILAAGCASPTPSGSIPSLQPPLHRGVRSAFPSPGVRDVFLADAALNIVTVFGPGGKSHQLTGFEEPQGITTDASRTLYVANTIAENIEEYAPPFGNTPSGSIPVTGEWPVDVAVARDGTVAAINICQANGTQCGGPGSVYFYVSKKAQSPCATVSGGTKISRLLWAGFDAQGKLYVAGVNNYTTVRIASVDGECGAKSLTVLQPSSAIKWAAGIQVDAGGNVAIINGFGNSGLPLIDVFAAPKRGSRKLKLLSEQPLLDSGTISSFALTKDGTHLYTAEPHYSLEYDYPVGGYAIAQVRPPSGGDLIEGVAVVPAAKP